MSKKEEMKNFPKKDTGHGDRFPYKDPVYYEPAPVDETRRRMSMGYTAQCSVSYLEQMGRRIDLSYGFGPWFRPVWKRR